MQELPDLAKVAAEIRADGGHVIALAMDRMAPNVELADLQGRMPVWLAKRGLDLPVWIHASGEHEVIADRFQLDSLTLPTTVVLDADGKVVASHVGQASLEEFRELYRKARGGG